jgi:ClpP class serine protease
MNWTHFQSATSTLNWLIFGFLFLLPILKHQMLVQSRAAAFKEIEQKRKSRVIALIHRKEVVNFLGLPVVQFLDIQDSEAVLRAIRLTPADMPIDLLLHTPAGLSLPAEQIAMALLRHKAKVTAFIPHYAMSGGALLALAAHELVMCNDAILGAVDPLVGQYPAASVLAVAENKTAAHISDNTFLLLEQARKATAQTRDLVARLLKNHLSPEKADELAEKFTCGEWTQDYPISVEELTSMGLPVSTVMPEGVLKLMNLYPQDGRRRPSVDFIAAPYTVPGAPKAGL